MHAFVTFSFFFLPCWGPIRQGRTKKMTWDEKEESTQRFKSVSYSWRRKQCAVGIVGERWRFGELGWWDLMGVTKYINIKLILQCESMLRTQISVWGEKAEPDWMVLVEIWTIYRNIIQTKTSLINTTTHHKSIVFLVSFLPFYTFVLSIMAVKHLRVTAMIYASLFVH